MKRQKAGIFITGTDTGVGKTYIAAGIAGELKQRGVSVGVMKPAETGCRLQKGRLVASDAVRLVRASGAHDPITTISPYRFRRPLAPAVAAALEGKRIDPTRIEKLFSKLKAGHDFMIVEGAGGLLVPLTETYSYLDLAAAMALPVVIVARPSLGTINHTLLTVRVLQERRVAIAGVIINYADPKGTGIAERTSPEVIQRISGVPLLGIVRHGEDSWSQLTTWICSS